MAAEHSWRDDERIKTERVHQNQARVDDGFKDPCIFRIPGNTNKWPLQTNDTDAEIQGTDTEWLSKWYGKGAWALGGPE